MTKLPATAVAAQAVLESGYGKGIPIDITTRLFSYNLFGVKAIVKNGVLIAGGNNGYVQSYTHEEINGENVLKLADFRAYTSYKDSFDDHARILAISKNDNGEQRYRNAFNYLEKPELFIREIWKAGYASDHKYLEKIIPIVQTLNKIPIWVLKL